MSKEGLIVHVVLDRSGSMNVIRDDTIGAFNTYVEDLAKAEPEARLSLTIFDSHSIDSIVENKKIGKVPELTKETFIPRAGTPLFDAIGRTVAELEATKGKNKVLVVITDGYENASREFSRDQIRKLLEDKQEKDKWLVLYLGANQDAFAEGSTFGTRSGSSMSYAASSKGMRSAFKGAAGSTARFSASGGDLMAAAFTTEERKDAADED